MGRRAVTPQQQAGLVESFRTDPEPGSPASFGRAALAAGVDRRTARKAWAAGWPGARPIRETIEIEKTLARAALRREVLAQRLDEAARLAQEDAVTVRAEEGKAVRMVTAAAASALLALHIEKIHEHERSLARQMQSEDPEKAKTARRAFADIAGIIRTLVESAEAGQRMQRVLLGEPTVVLSGEIGVRPVAPPNVTPEEIAAEIEALQRAADEARSLEAQKSGVTDGSADGLPQ